MPKKRTKKDYQDECYSLRDKLKSRDEKIEALLEIKKENDKRIEELKETHELCEKLSRERLEEIELLKRKGNESRNKNEKLLNRIDLIRSERNYYEDKYKSSICYKIKKLLGLKR